MTTVLVLVGRPDRPARASPSRLHLGVLALASLVYREPRARRGTASASWSSCPRTTRSAVIARSLEAIVADQRVRATRCSSSPTAAPTRRRRSPVRSGALVLERGEDEEPGRAAARQAGLEHARALEWDAVLMLDADSVIEPGLLRRLRARPGRRRARRPGAQRERPRPLAGAGGLARRVHAAGHHDPARARPARASPCACAAPGMAIRRDLALAHRFRAPASEDLFFTLDLLLDGVRCRHVDAARLRSEGASNWGSFGGQKVRYEAGRMAAARAYVPRLLRRALRAARPVRARGRLVPGHAAVRPRSPVALRRARRSPPRAGAWTPAAIFAAGLLALALTLVTGLIQARAGLRTWLALLVAPWYVALQGRRAAARDRQPAAPQPLLRADRPRLTAQRSAQVKTPIRRPPT